MDVTGVSSRYPQLPTKQDLAAVLAARPSMAELSRKAAAETATGQDPAASTAVQALAAQASGRVDLYL
jgi:hypothetical protein